MTNSLTPRSGSEILSEQFGKVTQYWGDLLRDKGRLAVIGAAKSAKSFFAIQLGVSIATGQDFLDIPTVKSNVLYLNYEISEEMFQLRFDDVVNAMEIQPPDQFHVLPVRNQIKLDTDLGREILRAVVETFIEENGQLGVLIVDPRINSMEGDENQNQIVGAWTSNLYALMTELKFATVIIHHTGKSTIGMGRGSSVFDGWVESSVKLDDPLMSPRELQLVSRDTDETQLVTEFDYPLWRLTTQYRTERSSKVSHALDVIVASLAQTPDQSLSVLRKEVFSSSISSWAYDQAKSRLESEGRVEIYQDPGKAGNHKRVRLLEEPKLQTFENMVNHGSVFDSPFATVPSDA